MVMPSNIDPEAVHLLEEANWLWSDAERAFIEARDPGKETTEEYRSRSLAKIGYEEIQDHGLAGPASRTAQEAGLRWLHETLSISNRSVKL